MAARLAGPLVAFAIAGATAAAEPASTPPAPRSESVDIRERKTGDLYAACLAEQGAASGWCSAYLMGVADTLLAFGNGGNRGGICRADYAIEDLAETYLIWARSHEAQLNMDMLAGASLAFRERWPCDAAKDIRN